MFSRLLPLGIVLATVGGALWAIDPELHFRDFFHMGPGLALHLMGLSALLFWGANKISERIKNTWVGRVAIYCSGRVTSVYIIHLVLIVWGMALVGFKANGVFTVLIVSILVLLLTLLLDKTYLVLRALFRQRSSRFYPARNVASANR